MRKNKKFREQNSLKDETSSSFPSQSHLQSHLQPEGSVSEDNNYIWKLSGFNICEFYTTAEYLHDQEKNQSLWPVNRSQTSTNVKITDVKEVMLNKLTLLFVRVKLCDKSLMHITATALKKEKTEYKIWIVKNDESKNDDQSLNNQQFKTDLQNWFKMKKVWSTDVMLMNCDFRYFWKECLKYYLCKIRKAWNALCEDLKTSVSDDDAKVLKAGRKVRVTSASTESNEEKHADLMISHNALVKLY